MTRPPFTRTLRRYGLSEGQYHGLPDAQKLAIHQAWLDGPSWPELDGRRAAVWVVVTVMAVGLFLVREVWR